MEFFFLNRPDDHNKDEEDQEQEKTVKVEVNIKAFCMSDPGPSIGGLHVNYWANTFPIKSVL